MSQQQLNQKRLKRHITNQVRQKNFVNFINVAKKYHPDAMKGVESDEQNSEQTLKKLEDEREKAFKSVTEAYSILSDPDLRRKYDRIIFGSSTETSQSFSN